MQWPAIQEFFNTIFRHIAYGRVDGTSGTTREAEPILVDSTGRIITTGGMDYTLSGPHAVVTGAVTVYTPWIDTGTNIAWGWYVQNAGANNITALALSFAGQPGGGLAVTRSAIVFTITPGNVGYTSDPSNATYNTRQREFSPLFAQSVRLGVHGGGAVTTAKVYCLFAQW